MTNDIAAIKTVGNLQDIGMLDDQFDSSIFLKYLDAEVELTTVITGTFKTLSKLNDKYRLFVLSNLATSYKFPYYKFHFRNGLRKHFFLVNATDKKPNASFFQKVIDYSGLQKKIL
jgi:hypothetical protein